MGPSTIIGHLYLSGKVVLGVPPLQALGNKLKGKGLKVSKVTNVVN